MDAAQPSVSVLLGAGASADAGIPTTVAMTDRIIDRIDGEYPDSYRYARAAEHVAVLQFIRHTLAADFAARGSSAAVDVERLFAAVELLIERRTQPWSPFVGSWHPVLEALSTPGTPGTFELRRAAEQVERAVVGLADAKQSYRRPEIAEKLEKALEKVLEWNKPVDSKELLTAIRERMLESLFQILQIQNSRDVDYLQPLLSTVERQGALAIATLNYDRSVETLAETHAVACDTGLESWQSGGELTLSGHGIRLLKLHGSIDWAIRDETQRNTLPQTSIVKLAALQEGERRRATPAVIFGEAGKLRAEGPYIELLLTWASELRKTDRLLVVGYSFRDQHINEFIARWFKSENRRMVVVDLAAPPLPRPADHEPTFGQPRTIADLPRVHFIEGSASTRLEEAVELVSQ